MAHYKDVKTGDVIYVKFPFMTRDYLCLVISYHKYTNLQKCECDCFNVFDIKENTIRQLWPTFDDLHIVKQKTK